MTFKTTVWTLLVLGEIFAYTLLTMTDSLQLYRTVPIVALLLTLIAFLFFIFPKFNKELLSLESKELFLFACWGVVVVIAIFLRIWLPPVDEAFLNMYITVTAILTSILWCIVSHCSQVSDPVWHWYIWFLILLIAVCFGFNQSKLKEQIYIINIVVLVIIQFIYTGYTWTTQAAGNKRCKHLWRISASTIMACTLLVGSILQKRTSISYIQWEMTIVSVEVAAAFFIVIDGIIGFKHQGIRNGIIGFKHQGIKYETIDTNDATP